MSERNRARPTARDETSAQAKPDERHETRAGATQSDPQPTEQQIVSYMVSSLPHRQSSHRQPSLRYRQSISYFLLPRTGAPLSLGDGCEWLQRIESVVISLFGQSAEQTDRRADSRHRAPPASTVHHHSDKSQHPPHPIPTSRTTAARS